MTIKRGLLKYFYMKTFKYEIESSHNNILTISVKQGNLRWIHACLMEAIYPQRILEYIYIEWYKYIHPVIESSSRDAEETFLLIVNPA